MKSLCIHTKNIVGLILFMSIVFPINLQANEIEAPAKKMVMDIKNTWLKDPLINQSIKEQNAKHANLTAAEIDKLDKKWRKEADSGSGELVSSLMRKKLSLYLRSVKQKSGGLYTEIFVMDNKGLNVGQSDLTSDYMQGDEAKWKETFLKGHGAVLVDEVEIDDSTQRFQSQVSFTISDSDNNPIGAITVGVDVDVLSEKYN